jgi:hypothetical protein
MRHFVAVGLLLAASPAFAEQTVASPTQDLTRVDARNFCVFENEWFSEGSIKQQRGVPMVCTRYREEGTPQEAYVLVWQERK